MKAPKLVKTKKSQLKVPVTTAGRKMQFYRNSNRSDNKSVWNTDAIKSVFGGRAQNSDFGKW